MDKRKDLHNKSQLIDIPETSFDNLVEIVARQVPYAPGELSIKRKNCWYFGRVFFILNPRDFSALW